MRDRSTRGRFSDSRGRAELVAANTKNLPADALVYVHADGFALKSGDSVQLSETDPPTIRLSLEPEGRIRGIVRHADGTAADRVLLYFSPADRPIAEVFHEAGDPPVSPTKTRAVRVWTTSDVSGVFEVRGLGPGPVHVSAQWNGFEPSNGSAPPSTARFAGVGGDGRDLELTIPNDPSGARSAISRSR